MKKILKRVCLLVMVITTFITSSITAQAASNVSFSNIRESNVTTNSARVDFTTVNPGRMAISQAGIEVKENSAKSWQVSKTDSVSSAYRYYSKLNSWYIIGAGKEVNLKLKAGTKYQYRCFAVAGGKKFYSSTKTFTTKGVAPAKVTTVVQKITNKKNPTFSSFVLKNLTASGVRIDFNTSNPSKVSVSNIGIQIRRKGTSSWTQKMDTVPSNWRTRTNIPSYYIIGSGCEVNFKMTHSTTYEYRAVCKVGGSSYYSGINSFTTPPLPKNTKILSYNANTLKSIGKQPKGSVYCSVYAMSYARVVMGYGKSNPMNFWQNGSGAIWGRGGMRPQWFNSQQAALRKLYDEINANRSALVYVYGGPAIGGHYVAVIGYTGVTNVNNLKMNNFVILDPDAYTDSFERSLGTYTGVKNYEVVTF